MLRFMMIIVFLVTSCRDQINKTFQDKRSASTPKSDDARESKDEDKPSPPVNISGTFLSCVATDSNSEVQTDLSCRLQTDRQEPARFLLPNLEAVQVEILSQSSFEVVYRLTAKSFLAIKNALQNLELRVELEDQLAMVPLHFEEPPKPWWQREAISDSNHDGLCQAGENCRFESSGLVYMRDDGQIYGLSGAESLCEAFEDGHNDWRLPSEQELKIAYAKELNALNASNLLNLKSARYWTAEGNVFDRETGEVLTRDPLEAFGVLCVRTNYDLATR